jgi:uncharacterized delta-60 repeat protein
MAQITTFYNFPSAATLLDNKIIISGGFTTYEDIPARGICRLLPQGLLDPSFVLDPAITTSNESGYVAVKIKQQSDGKIIICADDIATNSPGTQMTVNGSLTDVVRVTENGTLDPTFNFPQSSNNVIFDYAFQSDGKMVAIGNSPLFKVGALFKPVRFNLNGTVDASFTPSLFTAMGNRIEICEDNKILIFAWTNASTSSFYRLSPFGVIDPTFQSVSSLSNFKLLSNGKIIVAYSSGSGPMVKLLNADGTTDTSFTPYTPYSAESIKNIFVNSQGKIILQARHTYTNQQNFQILSANGVHEQSFGGIGSISSSTGYGCDQLFGMGNFDRVDGVVKHSLVRYNVSSAALTSSPTGSINQNFSTGQTLANLVVNGQDIVWYAVQNSCVNDMAGTNKGTNNTSTINTDTVLPPTTPLVNGTTYYASQTVNSIESHYRLPVTVHSSLAVYESSLMKLKIFPNPAAAFLSIQNDEAIEKVELYNLLGQQLRSINTESTEVQIDLSRLTPGMYIVTISSGGQNKSAKIVKK